MEKHSDFSPNVRVLVWDFTLIRNWEEQTHWRKERGDFSQLFVGAGSQLPSASWEYQMHLKTYQRTPCFLPVTDRQFPGYTLCQIRDNSPLPLHARFSPDNISCWRRDKEYYSTCFWRSLLTICFHKWWRYTVKIMILEWSFRSRWAIWKLYSSMLDLVIPDVAHQIRNFPIPASPVSNRFLGASCVNSSDSFFITEHGIADVPIFRFFQNTALKRSKSLMGFTFTLHTSQHSPGRCCCRDAFRVGTQIPLTLGPTAAAGFWAVDSWAGT